MIALTETDERIKRLFVADIPFQLADQYKNPKDYELRFLEDESDLEFGCYPLYEADPLERDRSVGEFLLHAVAFCRTKQFETTLNRITESNRQC